MSAFVTGGTGFIGKRLVRRLMQRDNGLVYVLVYKPTPELSAGLKEFWGADADRVTPIEGDISKPEGRSAGRASDERTIRKGRAPRNRRRPPPA